MDSKMKKVLPYIKSLIFIVGLIVIIGVCDYCFAKTGYIHYILQHVNEDDENYDTIVLGASHARSAIDPAKMWTTNIGLAHRKRDISPKHLYITSSAGFL